LLQVHIVVLSEILNLQFFAIFSFEFSALFKREIIIQETGEKKMVGYDSFQKSFEMLLHDFKVDQNAKIIIKEIADSVLTIYQMAKYFAVEKKRRWLDYFELDAQFYNAADKGYMLFYSDTEEFKSAYDEIVKGYNALRNYLTKKPYSTDKWVLNFDIQTLADGWDKNKEKENGTIILRKDGRY